MHTLAALLDVPRAHSAFLLRSVLRPPWSVRIQDQAPLAVVAVVHGSMLLAPEHGDPVHLTEGDVAILRGPDHYTLADDPTTPPQVVIHSDQRCTTLEGYEFTDIGGLGVRTWGNDPHGKTVLLTGTYEIGGVVGQRLVEALPSTMLVPSGTWGAPLIRMFSDEIVKDAAGQETVLDRMLDLLFVAALRTWLDRPGSAEPRWYSAHRDPVVGHALRLMHNAPAHPWTVAELATRTNTSRAAFARRFHHLVGEPPMAFLTGRRLALAAELLREPHTTITAIAEKVGYASPFALSAAFKRVHGVSPRRYRS